MNEENETGLLQDVRELDAVKYSASAGDAKDSGAMMPDQKKSDGDASDATDGDGTDGGADSDGSDSGADADGSDSGADADGTDSAADSDGTDGDGKA